MDDSAGAAQVGSVGAYAPVTALSDGDGSTPAAGGTRGAGDRSVDGSLGVAQVGDPRLDVPIHTPDDPPADVSGETGVSVGLGRAGARLRLAGRAAAASLAAGDGGSSGGAGTPVTALAESGDGASGPSLGGAGNTAPAVGQTMPASAFQADATAAEAGSLPLTGLGVWLLIGAGVWLLASGLALLLATSLFRGAAVGRHDEDGRFAR